jgi:hypothetical protein
MPLTYASDVGILCGCLGQLSVGLQGRSISSRRITSGLVPVQHSGFAARL